LFVLPLKVLYSGKEALYQVAAFEIGSDYIGNNRPVKTIVPFKAFIMHLLEMIEMALQ